MLSLTLGALEWEGLSNGSMKRKTDERKLGVPTKSELD